MPDSVGELRGRLSAMGASDADQKRCVEAVAAHEDASKRQKKG